MSKSKKKKTSNIHLIAKVVVECGENRTEKKKKNLEQWLFIKALFLFLHSLGLHANFVHKLLCKIFNLKSNRIFNVSTFIIRSPTIYSRKMPPKWIYNGTFIQQSFAPFFFFLPHLKLLENICSFIFFNFVTEESAKGFIKS